MQEWMSRRLGRDSHSTQDSLALGLLRLERCYGTLHPLHGLTAQATGGSQRRSMPVKKVFGEEYSS